MDTSTMDPQLARMLQIGTRTKKQPIRIRDVKQNIIGEIYQETKPVIMAVGAHEEEIVFNETELPRQKIILGIDWLQKHDPTIGWKNKTVMFKKCNCWTTNARATKEEFCFMCRRNNMQRCQCSNRRTRELGPDQAKDTGRNVEIQKSVRGTARRSGITRT